MTKNVLIVCGTFPPQEDVGGLRPAMFAKYLPEFGWRPIVLTRTYPIGDRKYKPTLTGISGLPPSDDIIEIEMADGNENLGPRGISAKIKRFMMPELGQSWHLIDKMIIQFMSLPVAKTIDVIIATYPDFGQINVGMELSRRLRIPVVVDFRDIAEQDEYVGFRSKLLYYRHIIRRYYATRYASHAIAVSNEQSRILTNRLAISVSTIHNGYDEDMFRHIAYIKTNKFIINYVGRILAKWLRNPTVFFSALDILMNDAEIDIYDLEVNFYGSEDEILKPLIQEHNCNIIINIRRRVDYKDIPDLISSSCINLVLTEIGRNGILTTKYFEYLAVKRPILCVPNDNGALAVNISATESGLASSNSREVADYIKGIYLKWKRSGGELPTVDSIGIEKYSRNNGARKLANMLDIIVSEYKNQ